MNLLLRITLLIVPLLALNRAACASPPEPEVHLGHDHARQLVRKGAEASSKEVAEKFTVVLQQLRSRVNTDAEDEHMAEIVQQLEVAQKSWLGYREDHCWLEAYLYVYPAGSRMFASQYHSCILGMNKERSRFLDSVASEYK